MCCLPSCNKIAKEGKLCKTCYTRIWRLENPERASFLNLRSNSKRRGKAFTLTFEDFLEFCYKYNYMVGKGRSKESYTIDCIVNEEGYHKDNLQVLTKSANSSKGTKKLEVWWDDCERKLKAKVVELKTNTDNSDCPF